MFKIRDGNIGYKKLLSEKQFLQVQRRARQLTKGTNLVSMYVKEQTIMYKTQSAEYEDNGYIYTQRIYIEKATFENIVNAKNYASGEPEFDEDEEVSDSISRRNVVRRRDVADSRKLAMIRRRIKDGLARRGATARRMSVKDSVRRMSVSDSVRRSRALAAARRVRDARAKRTADSPSVRRAADSRMRRPAPRG